MLVSDFATLKKAIDELSLEDALACDTETTGLDVHGKDELFGIVLSGKSSSYFLNFNLYEDADPLQEDAKELLREFFAQENRTWIFHNAKFDLAFLRKAGFELPGKILDVWVLDVLFNNQHFSYDLDAIAKRWGFEKLDTVKPYCEQHGLFTAVSDPELNKKEKRYHYDRVPMQLMVEYACRDGRITYDIADKIVRALRERQSFMPVNRPSFLMDLQNEMQTTRTMFEMEWAGARIDRKYCEEAIAHYRSEMERVEADFQRLTGKPFAQGPLIYKELFAAEKDKWTYTDKNNPSFDGDQLAKFEHPAAKMFLDHRGFKSQIQYFQNFLWFSDENDRLHTDYKQNVKTGRTSSRGPNLQNLTRPDEDTAPAPELFPVRKAIIPSPNNYIVMIDYKQIEYRLMLDYANARSLIRAILEDGLDVHTATANLAGCTRSQAKTCIAEGQKVLTPRGLVPIEDVRLSDQVWDGIEWVSHDGVVYQGEKEVIEYEGLIATEDHQVFTEKGWKVPFGECARKQNFGKIVVTETEGSPVRYVETALKNPSLYTFKGGYSPPKTTRKVYDILNAGPRNRFTVSGKLVSNCNFLTLYGGGKQKLADGLKTTVEDATRIQNQIFDAAPEIKSFIRGVVKMAEARGYVFNFIGRAYRAEKGFEYKLPNHLIQGTAAIIIKIAMNRVMQFLKGRKSKLILLVHDELIFDMDPSEMDLIPDIAKIMVESYTHKALPMDVDVSWSPTNLADKRKWGK